MAPKRKSVSSGGSKRKRIKLNKVTNPKKPYQLALDFLEWHLAQNVVDYTSIESDFCQQILELLRDFKPEEGPNYVWYNYICSIIDRLGKTSKAQCKLDNFAGWNMWVMGSELFKIELDENDIRKVGEDEPNALRGHIQPFVGLDRKSVRMVNTNLVICMFASLNEEQQISPVIKSRFFDVKLLHFLAEMVINPQPEQATLYALITWQYYLQYYFQYYCVQPRNVFMIPKFVEFVRSVIDLEEKFERRHCSSKVYVGDKKCIRTLQLVLLCRMTLVRIDRAIHPWKGPIVQYMSTPPIVQMSNLNFGLWLFGTYHGWTTYQVTEPVPHRTHEYLYIELLLLTSGSIKIGFAPKFERGMMNNEFEGYNLAKLPGTITYDAHERSVWEHQTESSEFESNQPSVPCQPGSVVGCLLQTSINQVSWYLNGEKVVTHSAKYEHNLFEPLVNFYDQTYHLTVSMSACQQAILLSEKCMWRHADNFVHKDKFNQFHMNCCASEYLTDLLEPKITEASKRERCRFHSVLGSLVGFVNSTNSLVTNAQQYLNANFQAVQSQSYAPSQQYHPTEQPFTSAPIVQYPFSQSVPIGLSPDIHLPVTLTPNYTTNYVTLSQDKHFSNSETYSYLPNGESIVPYSSYTALQNIKSETESCSPHSYVFPSSVPPNCVIPNSNGQLKPINSAHFIAATASSPSPCSPSPMTFKRTSSPPFTNATTLCQQRFKTPYPISQYGSLSHQPNRDNVHHHQTPINPNLCYPVEEKEHIMIEVSYSSNEQRTTCEPVDLRVNQIAPRTSIISSFKGLQNGLRPNTTISIIYHSLSH